MLCFNTVLLNYTMQFKNIWQKRFACVKKEENAVKSQKVIIFFIAETAHQASSTEAAVWVNVTAILDFRLQLANFQSGRWAVWWFSKKWPLATSLHFLKQFFQCSPNVYSSSLNVPDPFLPKQSWASWEKRIIKTCNYYYYNYYYYYGWPDTKSSLSFSQ